MWCSAKEYLQKPRYKLSTSTLKRVLGNLPYNSSPSTQTLNALALFLNHENWLSYKKSNAPEATPKKKEQSSGPKKQVGFKLRKKVISLFLFFSLAAIIIIVVFQNKPKQLSDETLNTMKFSAKNVAEGLPNTVIFNYDVSQLPKGRFFIQQDWDVTKRFKIEKEGSKASSVYYYPGYWKAKLLVDDKVVKKHDVHLKTDGWLGIIEKKPVPVYIKNEELNKGGMLSLKKEILQEKIVQSGTAEILSYNYVAEFDGLSGDDMTFEISIKNLFDIDSGICRNSDITIMCKEGIIFVPFSIPGCVGNLDLYCSEVVQKGVGNDFSPFGLNYTNWNHVKCITKNNSLTIFLNDTFIHAINYKKPLGEVAGVRISFTGYGTIDDVLLKNNKQLYLNNSFEN